MARRKASEEALAKLSAKKRRYVLEKANGKSKRQAALIAGFSESMAENAAARIETADVRQAFRILVQQAIPGHKIVGRLREGLDAIETKLAQKDGRYLDRTDLVAYAERRNYLELAAKMGGYYVEKQEVEVQDRGMDQWTDEELAEYAATGKRPR